MDRFRWQTVSPQDQRMDGDRLDALCDELAARDTKSFLVVRGDHIVYEWYASDHGPSQRHYTASLAKALVGGLSLMLAMDDSLISPDDLACDYIPQWKDHPQKSKIAIRHLATHSSGLMDSVTPGLDHEAQEGWKGDFWRGRTDPGLNPVSIAIEEAPLLFEPGTDYAYSNPGMAVLAYAVTAGLADARRSDICALLEERIMDPIGVPESHWSISYGRIYETYGLPTCANWGGGEYTARAVARVGRLLLCKGEWEGRQLVSPARVHEMLAYAGTPLPDRSAEDPYCPGSSLGWYTNFDGVWPSVPRDAFAGAGAGQQVLVVVPSLDMIVVRNGELLDDKLEFWEGLVKHLFNPLMDTLLLQPACPQSHVIEDISWAPASSVTRLASGGETRDGSDNWPLTWADDGHLYTAYGDGYGFDPMVPDKLGLGFAVVMGDPENGITGLKIRSDAENSNYGENGRKASGMLMVDGVLYMWARNADGDGHQSQLAWSDDYARTWSWCDWRFEEFGYMTFIDYGRNYEGARDKYVYTVSHDDPDAYESADCFVLARVPKDKITDRSAYEFFVELDEDDDPVWTEDVSERGAVFTDPGRCARSGISHNPGIDRYLWWQQLRETDEDTRFQGGFAIYDAPEPWGPWTTVYFTENWDVGPGETGSFPPKWMSEDGETLYLVFSGNDNFSVRKATLTIAEDGREG